MAEQLSDQELAEIEARSRELIALAARLRRTGPAGSPHVSPAAVAGWFDDLCGRDLPRLAAEIRDLREELAYLRTLQQQGAGSPDARLRAALQQIAGTTWKAWFADEAAQEMVRQARWALGYEGPNPLASSSPAPSLPERVESP